MPNTRFALRMLAIASVLAVTAFARSTPASHDQRGTSLDPIISTVLRPDLTFHSTFSLQLPPRAATDPLKTGSGFCLCGCGARCNTNADCGPGGECRPFITCCDKTGKIEWNEGAGLSSHRGEMPALDVNCK